MNARAYYQLSHGIPAVTDCLPHTEDSGPAGRPCFRLGTYRTRPDVVCRYPNVSGELDFWAIADSDGAVYVGEQADENDPNFKGHPERWRPFLDMQGAYGAAIASSHGDFLAYRAYSPKIRCSRIAFIGGLGYEAGYITLPAEENPGEGAPTPSAETFLGWYGFDASHSRSNGLINPQTREGWGRPAFEFTPLAAHADQSWAYAPATPTRKLDVAPVKAPGSGTPEGGPALGTTTTIPSGSWNYDGNHHEGLPPDDIDVDNWWLLGMIRGDPQHGTTKPTELDRHPGPGKATPLYWNPELTQSLTFFGESGSDDCTSDLFSTILWRIYATHCKTSDIDEDFEGIPFPPGFLVDVRIIAETYECDCTEGLMRAAGVTTSKIFSRNTGGRAPFLKIYMGTHFSVLYRCPFPIWRRVAV